MDTGYGRRAILGPYSNSNNFTKSKSFFSNFFFIKNKPNLYNYIFVCDYLSFGWSPRGLNPNFFTQNYCLFFYCSSILNFSLLNMRVLSLIYIFCNLRFCFSVSCFFIKLLSKIYPNSYYLYKQVLLIFYHRNVYLVFRRSTSFYRIFT